MKKNIAIVWGGYTSEYVVSEKSMKGIYSFLDKEKYNVYSVKITRDSWSVEYNSNFIEINKNDFSFISNETMVKFDFAYITIHGTPGEDGRIQGYFDMLNIPYSSCGVLTSALTMNKYMCNRYLSGFGYKVAESHLLREGDVYDIEAIIDKIKFPMFVKPNSGGSSFATTKVKNIEEISSAIRTAFKEANEVIIESFLEGKEITCGCYETNQNIITLPLTEVNTKNDFFDYDAKYNGQVEEITPARIDENLKISIQKQTSDIYHLIGAKGIIRIDYIIKGGQPYLLEVNTTPGMTATSFIPQQVRSAGLNITDVLSDIIEYQNNKIR